MLYQHNTFPASNDNGGGSCYNDITSLHLLATMVEAIAAMTQHFFFPIVMVEVIVAMMQHFSFFLATMVEVVVVVLLL